MFEAMIPLIYLNFIAKSPTPFASVAGVRVVGSLLLFLYFRREKIAEKFRV